MDKYELRKDDEKWKLYREGGERASHVSDGNKEDAIRESAAILKDRGGSLKIRKEDGKYQEERTYPRSDDPPQSPG